MASRRRYSARSYRRGARGARNRPGRGSFWTRVLVGLALSGWGVFHAAERFPEHLGPIVALTSVQTVDGRVTRVRDGDTIELRDVAIRLGSLDCSEMNTAEGRRAAERMRSLVAGREVICYLNGRESHDRKIGSCRLADGSDLGGIMMREGFCSRFR